MENDLRSKTIDAAAAIPATGHIKLAADVDRAKAALLTLKETTQDLAPHTELARRVNALVEPLLQPGKGGKLDLLRSHLDSGFNQGVDDDQFEALGGLPGIYFQDGGRPSVSLEGYPAGVVRPNERKAYVNGILGLMDQLHKYQGQTGREPHRPYVRFLVQDPIKFMLAGEDLLGKPDLEHPLLVPEEYFTIEFVFDGTEYAVLFSTNAERGYSDFGCNLYERLVTGEWVSANYVSYIPKIGNARGDSHGSVSPLDEWRVIHSDPELSHQDRVKALGAICQPVADLLDDDYPDIHWICSRLVRTLAALSGEGRLWQKKVPGVRSHPLVQGTYFVAPDIALA